MTEFTLTFSILYGAVAVIPIVHIVIRQGVPLSLAIGFGLGHCLDVAVVGAAAGKGKCLDVSVVVV